MSPIKRNRHRHCTRIGQWLKTTFEIFCNATSMHGFSELYYAKSAFWKCFWISMVGISIGMTAYHVIEATRQYTNQSKYIEIKPVQQSAVIYPPLKICSPHWLQWLYFPLIDKLNLRLRNHTILFGLSYLTNIYTSEKFDVEEEANEFSEALKRNNFSTLSEFYKVLAPPPNFFFSTIRRFDKPHGSADDPRITLDLFNSMEFKMGLLDKLLFCYTASSETISHFFLNLKNRRSNESSITNLKNSIALRVMNQSVNPGFIPNVKKEEYNRYIAEWVQSNTPLYRVFENVTDLNAENFANVEQDYSKFNFPLILFVDGFDDIGVNIVPEVDHYFFKVKGYAHKWKKSASVECVEGMKFIMSNETCFKLCEAEMASMFPVWTDRKNCEDLEKLYPILRKEDNPMNICRKSIYFINNKNDQSKTSKKSQISFESSTTQLNTSTNSNATAIIGKTSLNELSDKEKREYLRKTAKRQDRIKDCKSTCSQGCEKWSFEVSLTAHTIYPSVRDVAFKPNFLSTIQIVYPNEDEILITNEIDSQSWEQFVGNIGGVLGIWTGASVLSLVQVVYLCCCSQTVFPKRKNFWRSNASSQNKMRKRHSKVQPVLVDRNQKIAVSHIT